MHLTRGLASLKLVGFSLPSKIRLKIISNLFLSLLAALAEVVSVSLVIPLIQSLEARDIPFNRANNLFPKLLSIFQLPVSSSTNLIAISLSLFFILATSIRFISLRRNSILASSIGSFLLEKVQEQTFTKSYEDLLEINQATYITLITSEISQVVAVLVACLQASSALLVAFCLCATLIYLDPFLTFFTIASLATAYVTLSLYSTKAIAKKSSAISLSLQFQNRLLINTFRSFKNIILENKQRENINNSRAYDLRLRQAMADVYILANSTKLFLESAIIIIFSMFIGLQQYLPSSVRGSFSIALFSAYIFALLRLLPLVQLIFSAWTEIQSRQDALEHVSQALLPDRRSTQPVVFPRPVVTNRDLTWHNIEFCNVYFSYRDGRSIFPDISLRISAGDKLSIVGETGSGKSTFIDLFMGLHPPTSGVLLLDKVNLWDPVNDALLSRWRQSIAHVPQDIFLRNTTIANNITDSLCPLSDDESVRLIDCCRKAQVLSFTASTSNGLNAPVGESGSLLSGGQRQRIAIARALYRCTSTLVLDEATNALDNTIESMVIDQLLDLPVDKTIMSITHSLTASSLFPAMISVSNKSILMRPRGAQ